MNFIINDTSGNVTFLSDCILYITSISYIHYDEAPGTSGLRHRS